VVVVVAPSVSAAARFSTAAAAAAVVRLVALAARPALALAATVVALATRRLCLVHRRGTATAAAVATATAAAAAIATATAAAAAAAATATAATAATAAAVATAAAAAAARTTFNRWITTTASVVSRRPAWSAAPTGRTTTATLLGFVDANVAPVHLGSVHGFDRFLGRIVTPVGDESESTRSTGLPIRNHTRISHFTVRLKGSAQALVAGSPCQAPNEQLVPHLSFLLSCFPEAITPMVFTLTDGKSRESPQFVTSGRASQPTPAELLQKGPLLG